MDLEDTGFDGVEWMYLAQDKDQWLYLAQDKDQWWAFVKAVMSLLIP